MSTNQPVVRKSPLDPDAGSVPVPAGTTASSSPAPPHDVKSVSHNLNSAHTKNSDGDGIGGAETELPGMATSRESETDGAPNWQNQEDILAAASHGDAPGGAEVKGRDVAALRENQHPHSKGGEQSGPTGLLSGERNMEEEGTSEHDKLQQDLLDGKVSRDGEGSAGLPFDAGN